MAERKITTVEEFGEFLALLIRLENAERSGVIMDIVEAVEAIYDFFGEEAP